MKYLTHYLEIKKRQSESPILIGIQKVSNHHVYYNTLVAAVHTIDNPDSTTFNLVKDEFTHFCFCEKHKHIIHSLIKLGHLIKEKKNDTVHITGIAFDKDEYTAFGFGNTKITLYRDGHLQQLVPLKRSFGSNFRVLGGYGQFGIPYKYYGRIKNNDLYIIRSTYYYILIRVIL